MLDGKLVAVVVRKNPGFTINGKEVKEYDEYIGFTENGDMYKRTFTTDWKKLEMKKKDSSIGF